VRLSALAFGLSVSSFALAQTENPYRRIESAMAMVRTQQNVMIDTTGWHSADRRIERYQMRLSASGGKIHAEQYVDNVRKLLIVADGAKVWRYDPVLNEYTFMTQPETIEKTVSLVTAWSRKHLQRPLRALAGSVRWFTIPQFDEQENHTRVFQTKPVPGDWRGTDATFFYDDQNRVERLTIEDKIDRMTGLEHTWLEATFTFPASVPDVFSFSPPAGAKPAADLPVRISGDGG
jgi:hypothetical protein